MKSKSHSECPEFIEKKYEHWKSTNITLCRNRAKLSHLLDKHHREKLEQAELFGFDHKSKYFQKIEKDKNDHSL